MKDKIIQTIYKSIDEINMHLEEENHLKKEKSTVLFGNDGVLDSLNLINFIVSTEQNIEKELHKTISLTNEEVLGENTPLRTIETLSNYILKQIIS